jgi:uncharacterized protein (DUF3084 family)
MDNRLFVPDLQVPETGQLPLKHRLADLERLYGAAQEEIALLTGERDELLAAIKQWAKADRLERQDLLVEATTQDLRTAMKQLRSEVKRLKRENATLLVGNREEAVPRRLRA